MLSALREKIKAWHFGLLIGVLTLLTLLMGWGLCGQVDVSLALLAAVALANGVGMFLLARYRLRAWLIVSFLGWFFGMASAVQLFLETSFEQQCLVALLTAVFWMMLALFIGALAEFIRSIHSATHRAAAGMEQRLKEIVSRGAKRR